MARLDSTQKEQLNNMLKEGKNTQDILGFMKSTYGIDLPKSTIYAFKYALSKATGKVTSRKGIPAPAEEANTENIAKEIVSLLQQIDGGYKQISKFLRGELIKSRAEVYTMMKGAGIETTEDEGK